MFQNDWFQDRQALKNPPAEAVRDCSAPGQPADSAVAYWVDRVNFDGPAWLIRDYLSGHGAWDAAELCNHKENLERLFWCWCCDIAEEIGDRSAITPENVDEVCPIYLMR
jgi:hypothetical protein